MEKHPDDTSNVTDKTDWMSDAAINLPRSSGVPISNSILALHHHTENEMESKKSQHTSTEELASSISHLKATLESTADAILTLDLSGKVLFYNTKFAAIWGHSDNILSWQDSQEFVANVAQQIKNSENLVQLFDQCLAEPEQDFFEIIDLKDGRTFEFFAFPKWVDQQCVGVVLNLREATGRRQVEAALSLSEQKYRLLWATAGDAFVLFDSESRILEANAAVATIFGYAPEEIIGQNLSLLQPEHLREGHRRGVQRYLDSGVRKLDWRATEVVGLHRDGHEIPLEIAFNHLQLEGKHVFAGFMRDVTQRKEAEAEREELLAREQKARQAAENANRSKDEFLATLSHELRTPLNAIVGWSQLLSDERLSEEDKARGLETIQRNAFLQARLVEDILDVSRIVTGKLRLEVSPVELSSVIESAVESVLPAAQAKDIRLQRILDSSTGLVSGDAGRLQQVVWNLLANAIKFTHKGGRVQVRLERINSHIEIIVSDTGSGIPLDVLPHIFERFSQADQSSTRNYGGLGLGLAIVRHIVEAHGGFVEANSLGEGQGATFIVKLPLMATRAFHAGVPNANEQTHPTISINHRTSKSSYKCPPELQGLHVLVVDDEEDARRLVQTVLESCEARVTTASNAKAALLLLQSSHPDVMVSDLGMPGEDGYSLIRQVRALSADQGGRTPAAALTAYARTEDRLQVLRSGFQIHLAKPIEPAELVAVVANLAQRRTM